MHFQIHSVSLFSSHNGTVLPRRYTQLLCIRISLSLWSPCISRFVDDSGSSLLHSNCWWLSGLAESVWLDRWLWGQNFFVNIFMCIYTQSKTSLFLSHLQSHNWNIGYHVHRFSNYSSKSILFSGHQRTMSLFYMITNDVKSQYCSNLYSIL